MWAVPASQLGERAGSWPGLRSSVRIDRTRVLGDGTVEQRTHDDGSSLPPRVRRLAEEIREHRDIENGLHWKGLGRFVERPRHDRRARRARRDQVGGMKRSERKYRAMGCSVRGAPGGRSAFATQSE